HAVLDHAGQDAVQLGSLGGGADRGDVVVAAGGVAVGGAGGAHDARGPAQGAQGLVDHRGHRGLAVGAGDPDRGEPPPRGPVDQGGGGRGVEREGGVEERVGRRGAGGGGQGE